MRQLDLSNSANWVLKHEFNVVAMTAQMANGTTVHTPISDLEVPFLLDKFIYAILIGTTKPIGAKWKFGGYLKQSVHTGLINTGSPDATTNIRQPLFLFNNNLIFLDKISASFAFSIQVPSWFTDVDATLWEYTGIDVESTEQRLDDIDTKLRQLLGY